MSSFDEVSKVWSDDIAARLVEINKKVLLSISDDGDSKFDGFVNAYVQCYSSNVDYFNAISLSFGISVQEKPVNVDAQDCFVFFTQEMYERVLLDWAVRMGLKDGSLEVVYRPTVFAPARFCAFMDGLNGVGGLVEALCENVVIYGNHILR